MNRHIRSNANSGRVWANPLDDHCPLQVEVLYEVSPFLPIDERPCILQSGDALADLGGYAVAVDLRSQFQAKASLHLSVGIRKVDKDRGKTLGPKRYQTL
jgi:hypothetical protein